MASNAINPNTMEISGPVMIVIGNKTITIDFGNPSNSPPPTPIPLRTLTTLPNYERCIANPRFKNCKLANSILAEPGLEARVHPKSRTEFLDDKPASIVKTHLHIFRIDDKDEVTGNPSISDIICQNAGPQVHALSFRDREVIYHESRAHNGCYLAIALYQSFFELTAPNQRISIQTRDEEPVIVSWLWRTIIELKIKGPKLLSLSSGVMLDSSAGHQGTIATGCWAESMHAVLGFRDSARAHGVDYLVDMTRMQFGEVGRGTLGELYYLGDMEGYLEDMKKNMCEGIEQVGRGEAFLNTSERLKDAPAQARRAWERWENRDKVGGGWCEYCGVGESKQKPLMMCGSCKEKKVRYCCKEHQKAGWKLHKWTCEKKK